MTARRLRASSSITTRRASRFVSCATSRKFHRDRISAGWPLGRQPPRLPFLGVVENLSPAGDLREAAANFFRALRALDDDPRVDALYAMAASRARGLGLAINERLERAASYALNIRPSTASAASFTASDMVGCA
jgi:hypothetical protein